MELLSMLMNARITDMAGDEVGEVIAIHIAMGKLYISVDTMLDNGEEDDPDGGEEIEKNNSENIQSSMVG